MFTLAHLSDLHLGPMPRARRRDLLGKRVFGYINWHRGRKLVHRRDILNVLTGDLKDRKPDHIAITGDLVNIGLPEEFQLAAEWLNRLGSPEQVTAIPGNHDVYVRLHPDRGTGQWRSYMQANAAGEALLGTPECAFPFVRRYGDIALIGLSSAIPTLPFIAAGHLGFMQRALLGVALGELGRQDLFRIVLIHHPPLPGRAPWRRGLRDAKALTEILKEKGAELVLHGHDHEHSVIELQTATGPASVVGVPSASAAVAGRITAARYNEYRIHRVKGGWQCEMVGRAIAASSVDVRECERRLLRER